MIIRSRVDVDAESIFAFSFKEGFYETIITNCQHITFDSSTFYISTKGSPLRFYEVKLSKEGRGRFLKKELEISNYEEAISSCKNCIVKNY